MQKNLLEFYYDKGNLGFLKFNYKIEGYQKVYLKSEFEIDENDLAFFKDKMFREVLNLSNIQVGFSEKYLNTRLVEIEEMHYKFHFEFDLYLYYYLIHNIEEGLITFQALINDKFVNYKKDHEVFLIPIGEYKSFYQSLPENHPIKNTIKTLVETQSFIILSDEDFFVKIKEKKIKEILLNLNNYLF